ncbi:glycine betaine ABC transporter substrate-binding protein [Desulfohalovibrio reitneri]|uniref:glycine betaine ABC transporter substrate-binding protein n=1 Tax=Desulfohalovibrio reitneri TaxID=1307759 RepID=UPI0004A6FA81|nr:glycine betaine ABC transporter substrate-binding protein [Desulfohalovibrio reitneri]
MAKLRGKWEPLVWLLAFAAIAGFGRFMADPGQGTTRERTVRIGYVSWAEGIAMTYLAREILESELGYRVELTMADPAPIFTSLAKSDLDFFPDAWLPLTHSHYMDRYGETLTDLGHNYKGARVGLVVPDYVDVGTIPQLRRESGLFGGRITGIDSGAGIMEATDKAIAEYGLDMSLVSSSGAAMTASLKDAIAAGEPIVVTGWKPHWMFARWKLKFLDDPKNVYGRAENIHTIGRPDVTRDLPEAAAFFRNFFFTDQQIGGLMDTFNRHQDQRAAARAWMEAHRDLVESWLP